MKYFEVEKEIMRGELERYLVNGDGTQAEDEHDASEIYEICLGFNVYEIEDGRAVDLEFYPVYTDTETFRDNSDEVLAQIKEDYAPEKGWQNNNW